MIYPEFLKKNDFIGITALSSGCNNCLDELELSINNLKKDYFLIVTNDVYGDSVVSASKEIRAYEFNSLLEQNVKMIYIARGGDFLIETLPLIDFCKVKEKKIWIQGYSDPTSLLYILTTKYDLATIYGINGKGYDSLLLEPYQLNSLEINKGNLVVQDSFMGCNTLSINGNFNSNGIIIGGCIDVLRNIVNTRYDSTNSFLEKYKDKKIIWYFDIFSLPSFELMETLDLFQKNGWFEYSDTFLFGTVMFPCEKHISYQDAIKNVLNRDSYNIVIDANIGHVKPSFTIINGSMANVSFKDNKLVLKQSLLEEE